MNYKILRPCLFFAVGQEISFAIFSKYFTQAARLSLEQDGFIENIADAAFQKRVDNDKWFYELVVDSPIMPDVYDENKEWIIKMDKPTMLKLSELLCKGWKLFDAKIHLKL